jgi:hypothetical protein
MHTTHACVRLISPPTDPTAYWALWLASWSGTSSPSEGWWAPSCSAINRVWGPQHWPLFPTPNPSPIEREALKQSDVPPTPLHDLVVVISVLHCASLPSAETELGASTYVRGMSFTEFNPTNLLLVDPQDLSVCSSGGTLGRVVCLQCKVVIKMCIWDA